MLQKFLVIYNRERDFTKTDYYKVITAPANSTWRNLQEKFDPGYHHDNLRFFFLGGEIVHANV